jgi:hypothetical protein
VFDYVLSGTRTMQVAGSPAVTLGPGQIFYGPNSGVARAINNIGQTVGSFGTPQSQIPRIDPALRGAFIWVDDSLELLSRSTLDTRWTVTDARIFNDAGTIVATADDSSSKTFGHTLLLTPVRR